jgi:hypothetical protein
MPFREQPGYSHRRLPIEPNPCAISIRLARLGFLILALSVLFGPSKCLAATSGTAEGDGQTITGANLATEAPRATPPASASNPAAAADPSAGIVTPAFTAGDSPHIAGALPSALLGSYAPANRPVLPRHCVFFNETLCQAMRNKPILALATAQTAALLSDGVTTRQYLNRGYVEVDPVARILLGSRPTWARMAPLGAVQVVAGMWLAERMASSRHTWVRRLWWLPQVMGIAGNAAATGHNISLR